MPCAVVMDLYSFFLKSRVESKHLYKVEMERSFLFLLLSKGKKTVLSKVVEGLPWWYSG